MHIGHDSNVLNVRSAPEASDRLRHIMIHWPCQWVRMEAMDVSVIVASIHPSSQKGRNKRQFRRSLPGDCHGYLRPQTRRIATERSHGFSDRAAVRDEHLHQEVSAIRRGRNLPR